MDFFPADQRPGQPIVWTPHREGTTDELIRTELIVRGRTALVLRSYQVDGELTAALESTRIGSGR